MINVSIVLGIKFLLDLVFLFVIQPIYSGEPYFSDYGSFSTTKWLVASLLTILMWAYISAANTSGRCISSFYIISQFFLIIVPYLVLFGTQDRPYGHIVLLCGSFVLLVSMVTLTPSLKIPPPPPWLAQTIALAGIGLCVLVYLGLIATGGLNRLNFNFYTVYGVRDAYQASLLPGFGYLVPWVAYILNTSFLVYSYVKRRWLLLTLVISAQFLLFGMTNFKSFLFVPIAALGIAVLRERFPLPRLLGAGMVGIIMLGMGTFWLGEPMGASIVRRAFFVPAAMHGIYFDYFSSAPLGMLSGTRFASLFAAPYDSTTVSLIAQLYWGRDMNPNVGWAGDAFAQFGWIGAYGYAMALAALLKFADALASGMGTHQRAIEGLLVGSVISLSSSSLTSVFLTHGFGILLISIWVLSYYLRSTTRHSPNMRCHQDPAQRTTGSGS